MNDFLDMKTLFLFCMILLVLFALAVSIKKNIEIRQRQEKELQLYRIYVKPLEELIKEIRAKQHEFDNHMNAILNMHITIQDYDTLVKTQSSYISNIVTERDHSFISLLKISDKVLAGFIYSKLNAVKQKIDIELAVGSKEILVGVPESDLIEIVGTLIDNAIEACTEEKRRIRLFISSDGDKLLFEIKNEFEKVPIGTLVRFFDMGYSTKSQDGRGYGLYNANKLIQYWGGSILVENQEIEGNNYIMFRIEV